MPKKIIEWNVPALWGKIAVVSWGDPNNEPMLLVHGYMDTAATFAILVEQLPDKYYYVGFDLPGHGKSDPLPIGMIANKTHMVEAMRLVVYNLKMKKFVLMCHSMSCVIGLIYNQICPNYITKMLFLDPGPPLAWYDLCQNDQPTWYNLGYRTYYDNYSNFKSSKPRLLSRDKAISIVVVNRSLTEEQAEVVLSRSLVPMGIDSYKMSFEPRMKLVTHLPAPEDTLFTILTTNTPTLCIEASQPSGLTSSKPFADNLLEKCEKYSSHFYRVTVEGGHDFHITSPDLVTNIVTDFLNKNFSVEKSKL